MGAPQVRPQVQVEDPHPAGATEQRADRSPRILPEERRDARREDRACSLDRHLLEVLG